MEKIAEYDLRNYIKEHFNDEVLDVSQFDVSEITNMRYLFSYCKCKQIKGLESWDTSNVENMDGVFICCDSLTSLDLSSWDTSSVKDMSDMFAGCKALEIIDVSNWNTSNVEYFSGNIGGMFHMCSNVKEIVGLENFDTKNIDSLKFMFNSCKSLETLDLSNFDVSNIDDMTDMFYKCSSLKTLRASIDIIDNPENGLSSSQCEAFIKQNQATVKEFKPKGLELKTQEKSQPNPGIDQR